MKIFTGGFDVLESGIAHSIGLEPIRFRVNEDPVMDLLVKVELGEKEKGIFRNVENDSELSITFKNPEGLNYGMSSPIKVGYLNEKELHVIFRVDMLGNNTSFQLFYHFLVKGAV